MAHGQKCRFLEDLLLGSVNVTEGDVCISFERRGEVYRSGIYSLIGIISLFRDKWRPISGERVLRRIVSSNVSSFFERSKFTLGRDYSIAFTGDGARLETNGRGIRMCPK